MRNVIRDDFLADVFALPQDFVALKPYLVFHDRLRSSLSFFLNPPWSALFVCHCEINDVIVVVIVLVIAAFSNDPPATGTASQDTMTAGKAAQPPHPQTEKVNSS